MLGHSRHEGVRYRRRLGGLAGRPDVWPNLMLTPTRPSDGVVQDQGGPLSAAVRSVVVGGPRFMHLVGPAPCSCAPRLMLAKRWTKSASKGLLALQQAYVGRAAWGQPQVDSFVAALDGWKRQDCAGMVRIIRHLEEPLIESIKWGNPFFAGSAAVTKWFVAKEWINVHFHQGHRLADPLCLLEPSGNARMRTMRVTPATPLNPDGFEDLLRAAVTLDGPRKHSFPPRMTADPKN